MLPHEPIPVKGHSVFEGSNTLSDNAEAKKTFISVRSRQWYCSVYSYLYVLSSLGGSAKYGRWIVVNIRTLSQACLFLCTSVDSRVTRDLYHIVN